MPKSRFLKNLMLFTAIAILVAAVTSLGLAFATIVRSMIGDGATIPALVAYLVLAGAVFLTVLERGEDEDGY